MSKIYISTNRPEDRRLLLAEPGKRWRTAYSAKALAYSWEEANGFPESVKKMFRKSGIALFKNIELLLAFAGWFPPLAKRHFCLG